MIQKPIQKSVGIRNGRTQANNLAKDQEAIIGMLSAIWVEDGGSKETWQQGLIPLVNDGRCSQDLALAITRFQQHWKNRGEFRVVDGVVDPDGTTLKKLSRLSNGAPAPGGGTDPPQEPKLNYLATPLYVGQAATVSAADPLLAPVLAGLLSHWDIAFPVGGDITFATVLQVTNFEQGRGIPFPGLLVGVSPRYGGAKLGIDAAISWARQGGAAPVTIQILESLKKVSAVAPTTGAFSVGVGLIAATGFSNLQQMHGHGSGSPEEASLALALGAGNKTVTSFIGKLVLKVLSGGADMHKLIKEYTEAMQVLASNRKRAIFKVDAISFGVDVGVSSASTKWYALDSRDILQKIAAIAGDAKWLNALPQRSVAGRVSGIQPGHVAAVVGRGNLLPPGRPR